MEFAMYTLFSEETQILLGCFGFKISGRSAGKHQKTWKHRRVFLAFFPAGHPSKQLVDLGMGNWMSYIITVTGLQPQQKFP
jgi:hypothetical protein